MYSCGFISEEPTRSCIGITNYFLLTAFADFFLHVIFLSFFRVKRFWREDCAWICWRIQSRQKSVSKCECVCVCVHGMHGKGQTFKIILCIECIEHPECYPRYIGFLLLIFEKRLLFLYFIACSILDLWPSAISKNLGCRSDSEKIHRPPSNPYADQ